MSKTLQNFVARSCKQVDIDGVPYYVRPLTIGESERITRLFPTTTPNESDTPEQVEERNRQNWRRTAYTVGCYLLDGPDKSPAFPRLDGETVVDWADRIIVVLEDVEGDKIQRLSEAVRNLANSSNGKPVTVETLVKN